MLLSFDFLLKALPDARIVVVRNGLLQPCANDTHFIARDTHVRIAFDSKQVQPGELFVALRGARVDGHAFIHDALLRGAQALLVSHVDWLTGAVGALCEGMLIVHVDDTMRALQQLAVAWRSRFTIPIIAITGSVGKSSTKEMLRSVFDQAGIPALVSEKNQNTVLGVCVSLLHLHPDHQVGVFEVGISVAGEMAFRAQLIQPTIGVITMVAESHAEGLGGFAGIVREKLTLFDAVVPTGLVIINGDQPELHDCSYVQRVMRFGQYAHNDVQALHIVMQRDGTSVTTTCDIIAGDERALCVLSGLHRGFVINALAVCAVAKALGLSLDSAMQGIRAYQGFAGRFEQKKLLRTDGVLMSDCYNASPESMMRALEAFAVMHHGDKKIAIIGDMTELGDRERYWHNMLGRNLSADATLTDIILIGTKSAHTRETLSTKARVTCVADWPAAAAVIEQHELSAQALWLVKGARVLDLDKLVMHLVDTL